jgi:hypothetical protein
MHNLTYTRTFYIDATLIKNICDYTLLEAEEVIIAVKIDAETPQYEFKKNKVNFHTILTF